MNSDQVLDDEIVMEEIGAIKRIKHRKRAGRDNIYTEHLLYGGELLKVWPKQVFNAIIFLEETPNCLKTNPAYQTHLRTRVGKRPPAAQQLQRSSSLINYIAKLLEYIILKRMKPILLQSNSPHSLQTAYQRGVSCGDVIFATWEAALKVRHSCPFLTLEKAFDIIEKAVLLQCLYNKGICGGTWRIIKSWYTQVQWQQ